MEMLKVIHVTKILREFWRVIVNDKRSPHSKEIIAEYNFKITGSHLNRYSRLFGRYEFRNIRKRKEKIVVIFGDLVHVSKLIRSDEGHCENLWWRLNFEKFAILMVLFFILIQFSPSLENYNRFILKHKRKVIFENYVMEAIVPWSLYMQFK